ncbi:hypothetical protein [Vibrio variabilis]|uniref:hypothetical protein n=1 Tax=Vibrio variabilis TaxID=990271 RepID=UPI0013A69DB8|nr:hypothetical protein [Vibrio variabilis]
MIEERAQQLLNRSKVVQDRIKLSVLVGIVLVGMLFRSFLLTTESQLDPKTTLNISGPWEFTSIEPAKHGYIYTRMQVIETLLDVDKQGD